MSARDLHRLYIQVKRYQELQHPRGVPVRLAVRSYRLWKAARRAIAHGQDDRLQAALRSLNALLG